MEVDVSKENICINKIICEKKELIFAQEDMIVPDSKPDILNTINITGNVCVYKKEAMEGKVKIEGCVNAYIMYLPDSQNEHLRSLNATINFSQIIPVAESTEGMTIMVQTNIKDMECKVINGRKINVKAGLEVNLKLYSNENVEIIKNVNNVKKIQTLEQNLQINSLTGNNSTRVYIKDTLNINEQDEILEILKADINLIDNDVKISYNKVLSKCEADVKIMYLTQDGRIGKCQGKIPVVGFIDMQDVTEDNICDVNNEITNFLIRPNSAEEHSIYVEAEIEASCMAYQKKDIMMIQDLYSPMMDLNFSQRKISTMNEKILKTKNITVTSKTNIADLVDGTLLDVEVLSTINKEEITSSKIVYEGELNLNFIFDKKQSSVNNKLLKIPFEFSIDNPTSTQIIRVDTQSCILDKRFDVRDGGDIECNIDMEFKSEISQNMSINIIDNIEIEENRIEKNDYDSLILYIVAPGDTLWKIAKRFRSTVQDIAITNGLEDTNKIVEGQKLYIPKFSYMDRD